MKISSRSESSLQFNNDNDNHLLGSYISVEKRDALIIKTDLEVASSSKITPRKHKYRINSIKLFGVDLFPGDVIVVMSM
ncbi:hypothetical protein CR513_53577, partial [Mucuna pruriens]